MPSNASPARDARTVRGRDPGLDGLRGLAVLLVYLFHYGGGLHSPDLISRIFGCLTAAGWTGVSVFFALSGFLITGILVDTLHQPYALRNFYARRILRILPLYYAVLLLCAIFMIARGQMLSELRLFYLYIFFLQDLPHLSAMSQDIPTLPLYHTWTLAVEEQFYILWPLLLFLFRTRRAALRLSLTCAALSVIFTSTVFGLRHIFPGFTAQDFNELMLTHATPLALGGAVAIALRYPPASKLHSFIDRFAMPAFLLGLAIYLTSSYICGTLTLTPRFQFVLGLPGVSLAATALIPLTLRPGTIRNFCSIAPLGWLGRISYGFYIFHLLLMPAFDSIGLYVAHTSSGAYYQFVRLIAGFPITLAISWLSFQLLEQPFLNLKRYVPLHAALPNAQPHP